MRTDKLSDLDLPMGKEVRLRRILYGYGLRNGIGMFLDLSRWTEGERSDSSGVSSMEAMNPRMRLAVQGGFNGVVVDVDAAEPIAAGGAGEVPLVLELSGQGRMRPTADLSMPRRGDVARAVRLGADAVCYTSRPGSTSQDDDLAGLRVVRSDCERYGMPLVLGIRPRSDPRTASVHPRDGRDSFFMVDYFARTAADLGVDAVRVDFPDTSVRTGVPATYGRPVDPVEAVRSVVASAGPTLVLLSVPGQAPDSEMLACARQAVAGGATGVVFGASLWERPQNDALELIADLRSVLATGASHEPQDDDPGAPGPPTGATGY